MKKIFTPILAMGLMLNSAHAKTVIITVTSNQFSPSNTNVIIGDIVSYHFSEGFHNATSSDAVIPPGATAIYSGPIATGVRIYNYTVSIVGTYHYYCEAHGTASGSGMAGTFTASAPLPVTLKE